MLKAAPSLGWHFILAHLGEPSSELSWGLEQLLFCQRVQELVWGWGGGKKGCLEGEAGSLHKVGLIKSGEVTGEPSVSAYCIFKAFPCAGHDKERIILTLSSSPQRVSIELNKEINTHWLHREGGTEISACSNSWCVSQGSFCSLITIFIIGFIAIILQSARWVLYCMNSCFHTYPLMSAAFASTCWVCEGP